MLNISIVDVERAIGQLGRSEQGRQAMRDLLVFLENGGIDLDAANRLSFLCLLSGAWHDHAGTVLQALHIMVPPRVEPASD